MSTERRQEVSAFFKGKPRTPEHLEKMRQGIIRAWGNKSTEERAILAEKIAVQNRGRKHGPMDDQTKKKIGDAQRRAWESGRRGARRLPQQIGADLDKTGQSI